MVELKQEIDGVNIKEIKTAAEHKIKSVTVYINQQRKVYIMRVVGS
jgi:hypothetical protein